MGLTQGQVKEVVQRVIDGITETLVTEGRIELRNFGIFEVKRRKPRKARNPRTGVRAAGSTSGVDTPTGFWECIAEGTYPSCDRPGPSLQYLFVNGRWIRDRHPQPLIMQMLIHHRRPVHIRFRRLMVRGLACRTVVFGTRSLLMVNRCSCITSLPA